MNTITISELKNKLEQEDVLLCDVRTPAEYREAHVQQARLEPLDVLDPKKVLEGQSNSHHVYLICKSGGRAKSAAQKFVKAGFENISIVEGGTDAWIQAGHAVVRGKKTMSLERQVRIVAGLLVATGTALGAFVNPWFLLIPGFVGGGLTFAGITDFCGMGILLSKMPWNK